MNDFPSLDLIRTRWNEVLDITQSHNRVAWLAYFDGRLKKLDGNVLTLDFSDAAKLASSHDFSASRKPEHRALIAQSIKEVFGVDIVIVEEP